MESSRLTMAILKIDHQIFNLRPGFHLIGSDKNLEIYINSKTIDGKHALLEISNNGMKILDLQSENGTFINGKKIDCVKSIQLPKKCPIQFGNIIGYLKLHTENDSGYLEKLTNSDTSEIIVSSPEQNLEPFYIHTKHKKKITSTPNNDIKLQTQFIPPSTKKTMENSVQDKINSSGQNSFTSSGQEINQKSSFFVPETQPVAKINHPVQDFTNPNLYDSTNEAGSFVVPETQPNSLIRENRTNDILSNITDENIRKNIENMCDNDEFYIPETQEIFNNKSNLNSQCGSLYKISTQEFNASALGCGVLDASSDLSNDSENLFHGIQLSANIPLIKSTEINRNSRKENLDNLTNGKINDFTTNCEIDDDYDAEMSALKWIESNQVGRKNSSKAVSNSTTPDFLLEHNNIFEHNEQLEKIHEDSITPDFIQEINKKLNNIESNSITPQKIEKLESSFKEMFNENESTEVLEPTQVFMKPAQLNENYNSGAKNNLLQVNDDDLESTQMFIKQISLSNHSDKENTLNSNKTDSIDKNNDATQLFVPPQRKSVNNRKTFVNENDNSLEPTQPFIREKVNLLPEKKAKINFTLESDEDDDNSPSKRKVDNKKNKLMSSSDEETDFPQINKFKTPNIIQKTFSNSSSNSSSANKISKKSTSSTSSTNLTKQYDKSIDSNSQNNFDFITCTPQFDFIKPHQSLDIKQAGHLFNNVKSKNNKILLEESSDEDDIDKLLNILDKEKDKKPRSIRNLKKSAHIETKSDRDKSTNRKNQETIKETHIKNVTSKDSSTRQIRKSTRKTAKPNYIVQSYITGNFADQSNSESEEKSMKNSSSRKRRYSRSIHDDDKLAKITKTTSQHNEDGKNLQQNLSGNEKDDSEENLLKNMDKNCNISPDNETGRITTRLYHRKLNHKFVFTIVDASKYRSVIESRGGQIVDNPKDATILITNGIFRTCKFMVALARGIPIVSNKWLDDMVNSSAISTSYNNFFIKDSANEKKFKFSLKKTIELSAKNFLFKSYTFLITPKTTPPPSELIQIIACTGGQYTKEIPRGTIDVSKFYVVSDRKDNKIWSKIRKSIPNVNIITTEGILLSVMQHSIRFHDHLLEYWI